MSYDSSAIKHYSALEHMRRKASMWGFQTGSLSGLDIMIKEIVDNSIDEALDQNKIYLIPITFFVAKDKSTFQCLIQDFGRGVPVSEIVNVFTKEFTSGKYEEVAESYNNTIGTNGVGSKVVAALSKEFRAYTKRMDGFGYLRVEKGGVKDSHMRRAKVDKNESTVGTTVFFQPDSEILVATKQYFGEEGLGIAGLIERLAFRTLFKTNVKFSVRVVDGLLRPSDLNKDPVDQWKYLTEPANFNSELIFETQLGITPRQYVINKFGLGSPDWELGIPLVKEYNASNPDDRLSYDIDVFIDEKTLKDEGGLIGAVNATPIDDKNSIHFTMLQTVFKMHLEDYIIDKEKQTFFEMKYNIPLSGCVSVGWKGAGFDGQDKTKFTDNKFGDYFRSSLRRKLNDVPESVWERLFELIADHFEMAYAKYAKTQYKIRSSLKGIGYLLHRTGSFSACDSQDSDLIELIVAEGDSAAGRIITVRDGTFQALFTLSGKPINALRADAKSLVKNMIYQDFMEIIGVRPTDTDLSNMRFKRIIILTDADPDGYHIASLLIGIIKRINPLILEEGRVCLANPPLYALRIQGQRRPLYLRDQSALMDAKAEIYRNLLDIYCKVGDAPEVKLTGDLYRSLCSVMEQVGDEVKFIADQLNIDPLILEQLLHCHEYLGEDFVDTKKIVNILGIENAIWNKESNTLILVDHGFDILISLSHLKPMIQKRILPLYERYNWSETELFVTTKHTDLYVHTPCTFMMLYTTFKNITDTDNSNYFILTRFKGLGEMEEDDIYGTCVDPVTRCLTQIRGMGDVDRIYQMLGVDSEARKQFTSMSVRERLVDKGFLE